MKIAIGSDHAGYELKSIISGYLLENSHVIVDTGTDSTNSCDYPDFAARTARLVSAGEVDRGILVCGTGIGMAITANKFKGVRAALCSNTEEAKLSRQHNHANIICLGSRSRSKEENLSILQVWLDTPVEGGRHRNRVQKIISLEQDNFK